MREKYPELSKEEIELLEKLKEWMATLTTREHEILRLLGGHGSYVEEVLED